MLKGTKVLTADYFGTVLNDVEKETVLVLHVIRERFVVSGGAFFDDRTYWKVQNTCIAIPLALLSRFEVCVRMPKWLYAGTLRRKIR